MSHETEVFRSCEYWRPMSYTKVANKATVPVSNFRHPAAQSDCPPFPCHLYRTADSLVELTGPGLRSTNTIFKGMASGESMKLHLNSHLSFHSLPC